MIKKYIYLIRKKLSDIIFFLWLELEKPMNYNDNIKMLRNN